MEKFLGIFISFQINIIMEFWNLYIYIYKTMIKFIIKFVN